MCVEISRDFRKELQKTIEELPSEISSNIEVHGEDCRNMPYLDDASVDAIFGMNVVYFLNPLPEYLGEMNQVLKPGGRLIWGCKFANLPQDNAEFVNVSKSAIVEATMVWKKQISKCQPQRLPSMEEIPRRITLRLKERKECQIECRAYRANRITATLILRYPARDLARSALLVLL